MARDARQVMVEDFRQRYCGTRWASHGRRSRSRLLLAEPGARATKDLWRFYWVPWDAS